MSRNRMKNSQSLHWMGVVKWVLIAGLLSILGLSYMLYKNHNLHLAEETYRLQIQLDAIQKRNNELTLDLESMKSPTTLERRLVQIHSSLVRLGDARLAVVRMDQNTRARLARMGTIPLNLNAPVAAADASGTAPSQP